jgi:hypothetical protein
MLDGDRRLDRDVIQGALHRALDELVSKDDFLLRLQVHELTHVHRFAVYLERLLESQLRQWGVTIDVDYDYDGQFKKTFDDTPWLARDDRDKEHRYRPDLIIHHRGDSERNILVLEWKKVADGSTVIKTQERLLQIQRQLNYEHLVIVNSYEDHAKWCFVEEASSGLEWNVVRMPG